MVEIMKPKYLQGYVRGSDPEEYNSVLQVNKAEVWAQSMCGKSTSRKPMMTGNVTQRNEGKAAPPPKQHSALSFWRLRIPSWSTQDGQTHQWLSITNDVTRSACGHGVDRQRVPAPPPMIGGRGRPRCALQLPGTMRQTLIPPNRADPYKK